MEREGEREEERHRMCDALPPQLGTYPDLTSWPGIKPFGLEAGTQSTEPYQSGGISAFPYLQWYPRLRQVISYIVSLLV